MKEKWQQDPEAEGPPTLRDHVARELWETRGLELVELVDADGTEFVGTCYLHESTADIEARTGKRVVRRGIGPNDAS